VADGGKPLHVDADLGDQDTGDGRADAGHGGQSLDRVARGPEHLRDAAVELGEQAAAMRAAGVSPHAPIMEAHKKFSIPVALSHIPI